MSISAMTKVYESGLEKSQKAIALAYADHAHDDGSHIYPSVDYMAWKTGYSRRSVQAITKQLVEIGVLISEEEDGPKGTNRYQMDFSRLPARKPFRGAKSAPPKSKLDTKGGAVAAPMTVQNLRDGGAVAAPKPSYNHQSNHQDHVYEASQPKRERDENLDTTWEMLMETCNRDKEQAAAIWQLQEAFCESSGIVRPDIDTELGRKELKNDWWPVLLVVLNAAGGDLEAAKDGVKTAVTDMLAWKASAVSGPWSIRKKVSGVINAQRRAATAPAAAQKKQTYQHLNAVPVGKLLGM